MRLAGRPRSSKLVARSGLALLMLALSAGAAAHGDVVEIGGGEVSAHARWRTHLVAAPPAAPAFGFDDSLPMIAVGRDAGFVLSDALPAARIVQRAMDRELDAEPRLDTLTGLGAYAEPSPEVAAAGATATAIQATIDGATPGMLLALTTTPQTEETPVEIAALPVTPLVLELPPETKSTDATGHEDARQHKCLAEAVYFEARGEPVQGQYAVAQVVMNRVRSVHYPDTVCGVVYENRNWRNRCQFSFACDGIPDRVTDRASWAKAEEIATDVLDKGYYLAEVGTSTHYHADYVRPRWIRDMVKEQRLGRHIFYRVRNWSEEGV